MGANFKEVAMFRTDKKKYDANYDRIFGKKSTKEESKTEEIENTLVDDDEQTEKDES